jgi:hypothetical protein
MPKYFLSDTANGRNENPNLSENNTIDAKSAIATIRTRNGFNAEFVFL